MLVNVIRLLNNYIIVLFSMLTVCRRRDGTGDCWGGKHDQPQRAALHPHDEESNHAKHERL